MPKPTKNLRFTAEYGTWLLYKRKNVWCADGRSNDPDLGRHSLGTRDLGEAKHAVAALDRAKAIERGLAEPKAITPAESESIALEEGRKLYDDHLSRSHILDGARESSRVRYRSVFKKFLPFAADKGIRNWNRVTAYVLQSYLAHLEKLAYADKTLSLEITALKQVNKFLIESKRLPADCKIVLPMAESESENKYCWREVEVKAILEVFKAAPDKRWMYDLLFTLVHTGLRIGELVGMRWANIDLETGMFTLRDESSSAGKKKRRERQTTKGGRGRMLPIHDDLLPILAAIPRNADGYVFHGPRGNRVKQDTVRQVLVRVALTPLANTFPTPEDEIGFADGRLHSFRRYFCSQCACQGVPQNVVMRWLGHRDSKMVEYYFHLHDAEARRQMQRLKLSGNDPGK